MVTGSKELNAAEFLFNQNVFLNAHNVSGLTFSDDAEKPTCSITCIEKTPGIYVSGVRAPFGGMECSDVKGIDNMLKEMLQVCRSRGAASITIKQAPAFYQPSVEAAIESALLSNGFKLLYSDVNQYLLIDNEKTFAQQIDYQKRRSLRSIKEKGAHAVLFTDIESDEWYALFLKSRKHKNFPVTISREDYEQLGKQLPDLYHYIGIYLEDKLIANAICVQVTKDVLYYFLAASDPEFDVLSPSIMLVEAVYKYASGKGIQIIDLGISSVEGTLNEGLHFFKKNIGGIDSHKNTYVYYF